MPRASGGRSIQGWGRARAERERESWPRARARAWTQSRTPAFANAEADSPAASKKVQKFKDTSLQISVETKCFPKMHTASTLGRLCAWLRSERTFNVGAGSSSRSARACLCCGSRARIALRSSRAWLQVPWQHGSCVGHRPCGPPAFPVHVGRALHHAGRRRELQDRQQ